MIWLIVIGMTGIVFQNLDLARSDTKVVISFSSIFIVLGLIGVLLYKYVKQKEIPTIAIKLYLFIVLLLSSIKLAPDFLDNLATIINPISMFKNVALFEHEIISLLIE